jgi:hypothetical protein
MSNASAALPRPGAKAHRPVDRRQGPVGPGVGTRVIRLLTRSGLDRPGADAIFAVGIHDSTPGAWAPFRNVGFRPFEAVPPPAAGSASAAARGAAAGPGSKT